MRTIAFGGRARLTARAYRIRDAEMTRMRSAYDVTHDLVDADPH
ncbi:hypothetical protein [Gordonia sp. NPDC003585]